MRLVELSPMENGKKVVVNVSHVAAVMDGNGGGEGCTVILAGGTPIYLNMRRDDVVSQLIGHKETGRTISTEN